MTKHILSVLAFMLIAFAVQGASHFVINAEHYAGIGFMRAEPVLLLGFAAMIIQGLILSFAVARLAPRGARLCDGVTVSLAFGLFLASYIVLAEPGKFAVPSIPAWMGIEGLASAVQFTLIGLALGVIHRRFP